MYYQNIYITVIYVQQYSTYPTFIAAQTCKVEENSSLHCLHQLYLECTVWEQVLAPTCTTCRSQLK